jgi:uncharacterized protein YbaR (Trm112 family)
VSTPPRGPGVFDDSTETTKKAGGVRDWGGSDMIDKELLEILACPKCKSDVKLDEAAQRIICTSPSCGLRYPIRDGIPVMLIDEAEGGPARP